MKAYTASNLIFAVIFIMIAACSDKDPEKPDGDKNTLNWEATAPFPGYIRIKGAGFWIGEKFYTGLGFGYLDENYQTLDNLNDFYEYDSQTDTWTRLADFPDIGRMSVTAFGIGGKGYIGFGESLVECNTNCRTVTYKDLWEYDPVANSWEKAGAYDQVEEGATSYSKSYVINGKVYITFASDLWVYTASDKSLTKIGPVPESMLFTTGFEINDKIYIGTGRAPVMQKIFYEYDPVSNIWTKKADLAGPARRSASGFALKGKGYVTSGVGNEEISPGVFQNINLKDTWQYDPLSDVWTKFNDYPGDAYIDQISSNSEDKACVGTGQTTVYSTFGRDFWIIR